MQITAGLYKGRRLRCPAKDIRPVMSKMREAIFSMLYSRYGSLEGLQFLDLFCGSAVMSIEAASRGVSYVEAVECDWRKRKILQENLGMLQVPWKLQMRDVFQYLRLASTNASTVNSFDIIYLDPPFVLKDKVQLLHKLPVPLMQENCLVMLHLPRHEEATLPASLQNGLKQQASKYFGSSALCLYGRHTQVKTTESNT